MTFDHYDGVYVLFAGPLVVTLKTPAAFAYFSERNGHRKPFAKVCGWRLFIDRKKETPR